MTDTNQIKILLVIFMSFFSLQKIQSQTIINGAQVYSGNTSVIKINNDSLILENNAIFFQQGLIEIDKDLVINNGVKEIDGTVRISGNLINNDSLIGLSANSLIELTGNWTNNNLFLAGQNTTILNGTTQIINGTQNTSFYNLETLGNLADKKELQNVNVYVDNVLNIHDVEFATNQNTLSVLNPQTNAILRNEGFVSSEGVGRLTRVTNSSQDYLFPTGSTNGTERYRPIVIKPLQNTNLDFGVRLANNDANLDNLFREQLGDSLCDINPFFYHKIYGTQAADIAVNFIPEEDGYWNSNTHWENSSWEKTHNETLSSLQDFTSIKTNNWNNYNSENFALALQTPKIFLEDEIIAYQNEEISLSPIYNNLNFEQAQWFPSENLDCSTCLSTDLTAIQNTTYTIEIYATENCVISDTVNVIVKPNEINFPTGFSPNADGVNDVFKAMNSNLEMLHLQVFNRWGEKIYDENNPNASWDGMYKSSIAPIGVYMYIADYKIKNITEIKTSKGNLTLLR